eukprot:Skav232585  [mRNA]  locus=scaffold932:92051:92674:- [translate_table: standard]
MSLSSKQLSKFAAEVWLCILGFATFDKVILPRHILRPGYGLMPTAVQVAGLDPEGGGAIHVGSCLASCQDAHHQEHSPGAELDIPETPVGFRLLSTGPAHRAGIQPNDLLVAADDQLVAWRLLEVSWEIVLSLAGDFWRFLVISGDFWWKICFSSLVFGTFTEDESRWLRRFFCSRGWPLSGTLGNEPSEKTPILCSTSPDSAQDKP